MPSSGKPKRQFTLDLHGTTSQKTAFFIVTAVKISNLTIFFYLRYDVFATVPLKITVFWDMTQHNAGVSEGNTSSIFSVAE
jgi:hypothetical protein